MPVRPQPHQLLRRVKLPPQHPQHIHPGERLALQQHGNIFLVHFQAHRLVDRHRLRLMRSLLQHRRKSEELSMRRLVDHDFLMVLVDRRDTRTRPDTTTYACPPESPIL